MKENLAERLGCTFGCHSPTVAVAEAKASSRELSALGRGSPLGKVSPNIELPTQSSEYFQVSATGFLRDQIKTHRNISQNVSTPQR